jgi:hypothetical protein
MHIIKRVLLALLVGLGLFTAYIGNYYISHRPTLPDSRNNIAFPAHGKDVYISKREATQYYILFWFLLPLTGITAGICYVIDERRNKKK